MSYYNDGLREINGLRILGAQYFQSFMNIDIIMFILLYPLQRKKGISYQTKQTRKHIKVLNKTVNTTLPFKEVK